VLRDGSNEGKQMLCYVGSESTEGLEKRRERWPVVCSRRGRR